MVAITTYRRNGEGVATPVNLLMVDGKAYVYTAAERGKAKRIRNNPRVLLAPSTYGGKVTGPAQAGTARIMSPEESNEVAAAFRRKFPIGNRFQALRVRMSREHPVYIEVVPAID